MYKINKIFNKKEAEFLKQINKSLKEYIRSQLPSCHIKRTTHKWYIEESYDVLKVLAEYEKLNIKREDE